MDGDGADGARVAAEAGSRVHRLEVDVPWPPGHVAAYLIEDETPILVDAGVHGDAAEQALVAELEAAGLAPEDVGHVVITHPHTDHIGQAGMLSDAGATVHAPRPVLAQLERDEATLVEGVETVARSVGYDGTDLERAVDRARHSLERNRSLLDPETTRARPPDEPFAVGDRTVRPIHTPGHQINHYCFATTIGEADVLFAGDALLEPFRAAIFHVGLDHGAYEAVEAFYGSMDTLADRHVDRVYPGHGPTFTAYEAVVERTVSKLDALVDGTREALAAVEPATPLAVTVERVGEIDYPAPLLDTVGALGWLESRGEVAHELADGVRHYRTRE